MLTTKAQAKSGVLSVETAETPLTQSKAILLKLGLLVLAIVLSIAVIFWGIRWVQSSDPYVRSVLVAQGDRTRGHAIFQMNCTGCHGFSADGKVGPSLKRVSDRKSRIDLIYQVTTGRTPPMPQFLPESQDMADLLAYLESL
jgi:mono/diheme cytochrome c family protein